MRLNRRDFLLLCGLGSFGLGVSFHFWRSGTAPASAPASKLDSQYPEAAAQTTDTAAAPASGTDGLLLRFVAIADSGSGDRNQYDVANAMTRYHGEHPYSLAILAGDNIYNQGEIEKVKAVFEAPYAPLLKAGVKFRACLGNHDIRTANGDPQVRYTGFHMGGRYYTFREQAVQFFVLDTNVNADWKRQLPWLEQELSRSDAPWKIVVGHHPIYSSGVYGTDRRMVQLLTPLFKKYRVQLYINGHEHSYERTQPIDGTTYLITGIGGAYLRPVGRSDWTAYSTSRFGFSALEVYRDRMEIKAFGADYTVFDQGTVLI